MRRWTWYVAAFDDSKTLSVSSVIIVVAAYLIGSIPWGYVIVRWKSNEDIRSAGSGATGATNVMRRAGRGAGIATLVLDALKGFAAVYAARWLAGTDGTTWVVAMAGVAAIAGHIFPIWLGFKAGKGVATALGVFLAIAPIAVGCATLLFLLVVAITKYVSLGSMLAAVSTPVWAAIFYRGADLFRIEFALVVSVILIVGKHRQNIQRLLEGSENKLGRKD